MTYFFKKPFAQNGDITQIPLNDQGDGNVSYAEGWPEGYELDPTRNPEDARNLSRTNFNGLFFNITQVLQQMQIYGVNPYITPTENGGTPYAYPLGGACSYTDPYTGDYGVYYSVRSNNTTVPSENGITNKFWMRIFAKDLDTLKSNRISNVVLYYSQSPTYSRGENSVTVTIYAGTKCLFANGINSDGSLNNEIIQVSNDVSSTLSTVNNVNVFYFFLTSDETLMVLPATEYTDMTSEDAIINRFGNVSDTNIYYFNDDMNVWRYRAAESETFVTLSYSLVLLCTLTVRDTDVTFSYKSTLELIDSSVFQQEMGNKQSTLIPSRYIELSNNNLGQQVMSITLPSTATPFCANSGNMNAQGHADLLSSKSIVLPNAQEEAVVYLGNNNQVNTYSGTQYSGQSITVYNSENLFGASPGVCSVYYAGNYGSSYTLNIATNTFREPIEISALGSKLMFSYYNYYYYYHWYGYELYYSDWKWIVQLNFTDGTSLRLPTSGSNRFWSNYEYNLEAYAGKFVSSISVMANAYMYCHCYGYWQWWYNITTYIKNIRIVNTVNRIIFPTHELSFKVGANYLRVLNTAGNATPLIDLSNGVVKSSHASMDNIWVSAGLCEIPIFLDNFESTYTFNSTPAETYNAKIFVRYLDKNNDQMISGLYVKLEYWGGVTYTVCENKNLTITQDLLFDIPNGKYIKSITVGANKTDDLLHVQFGAVQIFNNVTNEASAELQQYPILQATAADTDRTHYCYNELEPIQLDDPGYIVLNSKGAALLPGYNVIWKQKEEPNLQSDPALRDGDIWLDLSKEPIISYKRIDGQWKITDEIPIGYVSFLYSDPSATATVSGTGITAATVDARTFNQEEQYSGTYVFEYVDGHWTLNDEQVSLTDYGISVTGTAVAGDQVTVAFTARTSTINEITTYEYNQNGYNINAYTENIASLSGRDGRDGVPGRDGKNGLDGAQGPAGIGIASGGRTGQILTKLSNLDYETGWTTMASTQVFNGGTAGQIIVKNSSEDLDFSWAEMPSGLPNGGTTGQALIKASNTDKDVEWGEVQSLPAGGSSGYILTKRTGENYDCVWSAPGETLSVYDNDNTFMFNVYYYAQSNSYSAVTIENFHSNSGIDGVNDDGAVVLSTYYSSTAMNVYNSSANPITFRLNAITSTNPIYSLIPHWESTGTATFYISTDSGTTWSQLSDYGEVPMNYNTSFIIKITLAAGASVKNIALITK